MTEENKGAEGSAEFVPPLTFSEDGKTVTWQKSETEKVEFPADEISARFNKAVLADKQGQELGEARQKLTEFENRFGDINKQLAEADDPEAVLAKMRQAVEGKPAATDAATGDDGWLKELYGEDESKTLTLEQVKGLLDKQGQTLRKEVSQTLASARINEEIDAAIADSGLPNKELPDGSKLYDFIAEAALKAGVNNQIPYPELVQTVTKAFGEAWEEKKTADAAAEAGKTSDQGTTLDDFGKPIDLSSKRQKVDWDNPEDVKRVRDNIARRLGFE